MRTITSLLAVVLTVALVGAPAQAADAVTPGTVQVDATIQHLGVVWFLEGDDDGDSSLLLEFRPQGGGSWQPAAPAIRATPDLLVNGELLQINSWAASAMFLEPATAYQLRLTLIDLDGGSETRIVDATTRAWPAPGPGSRHLFVAPGSSGGNGSAANPYRGLQSAADAAQPGDVLHVAPGLYDSFRISRSGTTSQPIVFRGPADGSAIVDGGGTDRGVVTVGTDSGAAIASLHIVGLTIRNGRWGVDAQHSSNIAILRNHIHDVDYGVLNRRDADLERHQVVCENVIEGKTPWPDAGIPSERGIDLRGFGNVVCHNRVHHFGDCVSLQPNSGASFGNDVYGNDVAYCVDDGIEIDYNQANVRVWRNRVFNARMGVSVQPIRGGPAYIFRNELFNLEGKALKVHNSPAGLFVAHNTGVKLGNGFHDTGSSIWNNATLRNNLFLGSAYAFELLTIAAGYRDFDANAWGTTRAMGGSGAPYFKWNNVRYDRLPDLQAIGVESNGIEVTFDDLRNAALPLSWDVAVEPGSRDLRLVEVSLAVDAGADLPNLNDAFALEGSPDLGALELGVLGPVYGPVTVFAAGFERGSSAAWSGELP